MNAAGPAIRASAPGKLVVSGEYAVLEKAPAVVCAMPARATVVVSQGAHRGWHIHTHQAQAQTLHLDWRDNVLVGENGENVDLLDAVNSTLDPHCSNLPQHGVTLHLDTSSFFARSKAGKLGLGSSAALCTALVGALARLLGKTATLETALAAHRQFQHGAGSGIDVAASFGGGLLEFRLGPPVNLQALQWPVGLHGLVVWSGSSASTTRRLKTLAEFATAQPRRYRQYMDNLGTLSESVVASFGDAERALEQLDQFTRLLRELSDSAGLGVWTGPHDQLAQLASHHQVHYKTSGAGGGDCGLALSVDRGRLEALRRTLDENQFLSWPLICDHQGLIAEACSLGG